MNKRTFCKAALLSATALVLAAQAAVAEPKVNMLHQWYRGSDAEAIKKLGEMFEEKGGTWEQTSVAGHTANTIAKLRADVVSGNAPPAVQLKGPEIAEWAETGLTADLNEVAAEEHWDHVRVDGSVHRTWWFARWPRREVPAGWLDQLLFGIPATRTVTVVFEPIAPSRS